MMLKMEGGEFLIRREWWMCVVFIIILLMIESVASQAERHFIASSVLKRSRRYFDIPKLNHL